MKNFNSIIITFFFICMSLNCEQRSKKVSFDKSEKKSFFRISCKNDKSGGEKFLVPATLHEFKNIRLDSPCCNIEGIIRLVDKNCKTNISESMVCRCETDLFLDSVVDLRHYHKVIEVLFADAQNVAQIKSALDKLPVGKPAFKTEDKGTPAWRLSSVASKDRLFLVFSNFESDFYLRLKSQLERIGTD